MAIGTRLLTRSFTSFQDDIFLFVTVSERKSLDISFLVK